MTFEEPVAVHGFQGHPPCETEPTSTEEPEAALLDPSVCWDGGRAVPSDFSRASGLIKKTYKNTHKLLRGSFVPEHLTCDLPGLQERVEQGTLSRFSVPPFRQPCLTWRLVSPREVENCQPCSPGSVLVSSPALC